MLSAFYRSSLSHVSSARLRHKHCSSVHVAKFLSNFRYSYLGKIWPFLILSIAGACSMIVQLWLLKQPALRKRIRQTAIAMQLAHKAYPAASIWTLLHDLDVQRSALALVATNAIIAAIEPSFPLWCSRQFNTPPQTVGVIFLAISISFTVGAGIGGGIGLRVGRKRTALGGQLLAATGVCGAPCLCRH